jgi:hypothetical protein
VSEEFQDLLRAEMERVPASPRTDLVREAHQSQRRRQQARRRAGLAATGCVAAVAAVATVVAMQPGASRPGTSAATGSSAQSAPVRVDLGGPGAAVQTTAAPVTATFTTETDTTAAAVLDEAAQAAGSGNVQLINGWPTAPYWHTLSQQTTSSCPGQVITTNTWLGKDGAEVTGDKVLGPNSSNPTSSCFDPGTGYSPVIGASAGVTIGGQHYSWAQFAALPTDPAKLWPILQADANVGTTAGIPGVALGTVRLYTTYWTIVAALTSDPVSPAMRAALFKVMEKFPSVHLTGTYTDSLGRTGTAITFTLPNQADGGPLTVGGSFTDVIDAGTGQVLAQLDAAQPVPKGCVRATVGGEKGAHCAVGGADVRVFISAGPADTTPLHGTELTMPSVVGDSFAQARRVLIQAGINSISVKGGKLGPRAEPIGVVIAQSPTAGTRFSSLRTPALTLRS